MNKRSRIVAAAQGGANNAREAIIGARVLQLLDQEIRGASEDLTKSMDGLASLIAQRTLAKAKGLVIKLEN